MGPALRSLAILFVVLSIGTAPAASAPLRADGLRGIVGSIGAACQAATKSGTCSFVGSSSKPANPKARQVAVRLRRWCESLEAAATSGPNVLLRGDVEYASTSYLLDCEWSTDFGRVVRVTVAVPRHGKLWPRPTCAIHPWDENCRSKGDGIVQFPRRGMLTKPLEVVYFSAQRNGAVTVVRTNQGRPLRQRRPSGYYRPADLRLYHTLARAIGIAG
jgi:hypothetical protein